MHTGEEQPPIPPYASELMNRRTLLQRAAKLALLVTGAAPLGDAMEGCGSSTPEIPALPAFELPKRQHDLVVFVKNTGEADPVPTEVFPPIFNQAKQFVDDATYGKVPIDFSFHPGWIPAARAYNDKTSDPELINIENDTLRSLQIDESLYTGVIFVSTGGQAFGATEYNAQTKTSRMNITVDGIYDRLHPSANGYPAVLDHELVHSLGRSPHDGYIRSRELNDYGDSAITQPDYGASIMGGAEGSNIIPILSSVDRVALGCMTSEQVQTIDRSGQTTVLLSELQNAQVPGKKVARIPLYDAAKRTFPDFLYVEYRADRTDSGDGGVEIRRWNEQLNSPGYQETLERKVSTDVSPTGIEQVSVMQDGDVFRDDPHRVRIKQISHTATTVELQITTPAYS